MTGVEVLSSEKIVAATNFNWIGFWITIGIVCIVSVFIGIISGSINNDMMLGLGVFLMSFIFLSAIMGITIGYGTGKPTKYETYYKVTINNSVSMNEFMDKYEILDQEGKIYTVKERE